MKAIELSPALIAGWRYENQIKAVLRQFLPAAQAGGRDSVCRQLLEYIQRGRPAMVWSRAIGRLGFAGLTLALPINYIVLLNPDHVRPTIEGAAIVAHELGHALWNSHGFDSSEEEYYCDRVGGRAYQEMLLAAGTPPEKAELLARARFPARGQSLADWIAARRRHTPPRLFQPWTWFDRRRPADIASNLLLGPWINLGLWGHPAWWTRRDLGD